MREPLFTGSGVAIVTPFTNETVNFAALGRLLDFQLQNGTDAVIVCGTTGEATTMSYHERMRTIEFCVERVDGRVPVIAGSGSNATETAVTLSRDAERAGADGLLVVTPYYNKASQKGLIRHYTAIADAVDRPVILYDVPSRTGVTIAPETYAELAKHPNINGVKEAGGNFSNIQKTRNLCPADFSIWSGNDDETAAICMLGGRGVISVVANVLPAQMHRLTELCLANDYAAAGKLQLELKDFCDAMFCDVNPIPVKTALNLMGWEAGPLRLPLCEPDEAVTARIRRALERYGLLEAEAV
ncbi:4-hydroxy-tetrahydrodipicolinate synthase [Dysosmobacter sp.]|uniref:4-hydroxy-tetrahydrodipicolinate synthase n=1 Tax=Dysosmobacter sp. TaxID=2591382 RepID=UPI002D7F863F|nr:4-hydroxy-tetrahydrodipicolinate synthase [Dysosmobacter sp.]MCI6055115.1 4-hydroxy-tetrahydrodipicolinate synthase [Dysosmobacter sp.]